MARQWAVLAMIVCTVSAARADLTPIEIKEALSIQVPGGRGGRTATPVDPIAAIIASGQFTVPKAADKISLPGGQSATWRAIKANKDGLFQTGFGAGYVFCSVDLPDAAVMLLEAAGDTIAYVNGEARGGDPYSNGYLRLPVSLHKGENALLFAVGRGRLKVRLLPVRSSAMLDTADPTLPDILTTDRQPLWAAVVVQNTTDKPLDGLKLAARTPGVVDALVSDLPAIAPMTIRKVPFKISVPSAAQGQKLDVALTLQGPSGKLDEGSVTLRVCKRLEIHKRTFISWIDGSVQYYAVNPAQKPSPSNAFILTLHGAGVEALGQAQAYKSKDWATIVAPTNRRPYGFDWEDIGQFDALEVLELAKKDTPHDPHRVILTGHSMGGHGTWHIGLTYPDRFAAIGPSAGWSSFASYTGGRGGRGRAATQPSAMEKLLATAASGSDTMALVRNSLNEDVYILHGANDDNVPVREARLMRDALSFHPRLTYHEEPGAGHWWGSKCVDWPPMFEMFQKAYLPSDNEVNEIEYTTVDPTISGHFHWAVIEQQIQAMRPSTIKLARKDNKITGTTENVAMLRLFVSALNQYPTALELDHQRIDVSGQHEKALIFERRSGQWSLALSTLILKPLQINWKPPELDLSQKNAGRGGPFITAFYNHFVFVYGTHGTPEAAADSLATARLLAENFYYRGNGSVDVLADTAFDPAKMPEGNVILFGNSDCNSAWENLAGDAPIQVRNGSATVGQRRINGDDLAVLFLYPRPDSVSALVGAIAFTGHAGAVEVSRLPLLTSGVGYPDWTVISADSLTQGTPGVRAAGYFGNDWSLAHGETAIESAIESK